MLLVLDVGNSNVVCAVYQGEVLRTQCRIETDVAMAPEALAEALATALFGGDLQHGDIEAVAVSTVVPGLSSAINEVCATNAWGEPLYLTPALDLGIAVDVENPEYVGADRLADAIAVHVRYGGPAVIVDFGTATTVDGIDAAGTYVGGAIAAGLRITHDALVSRTALLPNIELTAPPSVLAKDTISGMQAGLVLGYVGLVEGLVARARAELGGQAKVVATGGLAGVIGGLTEVFDVVDQEITLEGIRLFYERNRP